MKPLEITCLLRLSKSQLSENGFKDSIIENIYEHLLEYMSNNSHRIAFPDLSILVCIEVSTLNDFDIIIFIIID